MKLTSFWWQWQWVTQQKEFLAEIYRSADGISLLPILRQCHLGNGSLNDNGRQTLQKLLLWYYWHTKNWYDFCEVTRNAAMIDTRIFFENFSCTGIAYFPNREMSKKRSWVFKMANLTLTKRKWKTQTYSSFWLYQSLIWIRWIFFVGEYVRYQNKPEIASFNQTNKVREIFTPQHF
jgi:hypothetical protein